MGDFMNHHEQAEKLSQEWIKPLNESELKAYDKLCRAYAKEQKRRKINRAYSTGGGAVIIIEDVCE